MVRSVTRIVSACPHRHLCFLSTAQSKGRRGVEGLKETPQPHGGGEVSTLSTTVPLQQTQGAPEVRRPRLQSRPPHAGELRLLNVQMWLCVQHEPTASQQRDILFCVAQAVTRGNRSNQIGRKKGKNVQFK